MPEYIFQGTLKLDGVDFYITADNEDDARKKAEAGFHEEYHVGGAESIDWEIDPMSLQINK